MLVSALGVQGRSDGACVLAGWPIDVDYLKSVVPGLASMKTNAAAGFVLPGVAVWFLHSSSPGAVILVRAFTTDCRLAERFDRQKRFRRRPYIYHFLTL